MTIWEFQEKYKTKEDKRKALSKMNEKEVQEIIDSCGTPQGKSAIKVMWLDVNGKNKNI